jgi:TonB-dependent receptor
MCHAVEAQAPVPPGQTQKIPYPRNSVRTALSGFYSAAYRVFLTRKRACWLLYWLTVVPALAQTGVVTGRVTDQANGEPLPGASVVLKGTTTGTSTDLKGEFTLSLIRAGAQTLVLNYIGYQPEEVAVAVRGGQTVRLSVALKPAAQTLGEVAIKGSLEGQQKALNQQLTADNIKNIVSADLISRFPDLNVAEALQRVPGVNISRSRGEGSTISLRGTPQHFTTININGEQVPSTRDDGSRNESLDLIPADQLASMEVTKALTPDMDGDAIGGSVNLVTPTARKRQSSLRAELGAGYNSLAQNYNGIGRLRFDKRFLANDRFTDGRLGVLVGFSYFGTANEEDSYEAAWSPFGTTPIQGLGRDTVVIQNYQYRDLLNRRQRIGATLTLDYRLSANSNLIFNFMYNRRQDSDQRNRLRGILNESAAVQWTSLDTIRATQLRRDITLSDYYSENLSYNLQGNHLFGQARLDWGAYYSPARRVFDGIAGEFERGAANRIDVVTTTPAGIYTDLPGYRTLRSDLDFHDPFIISEIVDYELNSIRVNSYNAVAKFNLQVPYRLGSATAFWKVGGKYRQQGNQTARDNRLFNYSDPNRLLEPRAAFASIVGDFEDQDFMQGRVRFGPSIDPDRFRAFVAENNRLFVFDQVRTNRNSYNDSYSATETIAAGYAMTRIQWAKLMLLAGLRYEDNRVSYDAYRVNNISGAFQPISDVNTYAFVLPNVHLRYALNKLTNLRAALTWSYARPNFTDIVPFLSIDEDGSRIVSGNPDLRASRSVNADLLLERYLGNVGIVSGGVFYKNIDRFQFQRRLQFLRPGDPFYEEFPGFAFTQTQNGRSATVYGFELNTQVPFTFLPGRLSGLGSYFNYTFTESDAFTEDRSGINLPGQAAHTFNAALTFDYKALTARVMVNHNGSFLQGVAGEARNDIVQVARTQVDANASLKIRRNVRVFAEFMNLTNAPTIRYQGIRERVVAYAYFGWWNRFGLSYTL